MLCASSFDTNMLIGIAIDVFVVAIALIFLFIGAKKGLIKMSFGLVTAIVVIALSVVLVSPITSLLTKGTTLDEKLMGALNDPVATRLPESYTTLYYMDVDADPETPDEIVCDVDGTPMPYTKLFENNTLGTTLRKVIKPIVAKSLETESRVYLIDAVTSYLAYLIITVCTFILLLIILRILMWLILKLFKKLASNVYVIYSLDRVFGGVLGLVFGAVIVLALVTIIQLLQNFTFMEPVMVTLNRSYLTKFIMNNNFLYSYLADKIDFTKFLSL